MKESTNTESAKRLIKQGYYPLIGQAGTANNATYDWQTDPVTGIKYVKKLY